MGEVLTPDGEGETRSDGTEERTEYKQNGQMLEWRRRKAEDLRGKRLERREFSTDTFELREDSGGVLRFSGYASVTEQPYDVGHFTETIRRGAFKRTLSETPDVQLLINHGEGGSGMPIARTGRNMTLVEDDRGLRVDAELDTEDPDVQLLARKMRNGLIDQMSFAFQATDQEWNDDYTERSIKAASIHRGDVSVVNQGANGASTAVLRSRELLAQVQRVTPDAFVAALVEWRDYTLLPAEERDGQLSSQAMDSLTPVLNLMAVADDALDQAQPLLADLMNVPNPDQDSGSAPTAGNSTPDGQQTPSQMSTTGRGLSSAERQSLAVRRLEQQKRARKSRRAA